MPSTMEDVPTVVATRMEEPSAPVGKDTSFRLTESPVWVSQQEQLMKRLLLKSSYKRLGLL